MKRSLSILLATGIFFCLPVARADHYGVFATFREDFVFSPTFANFMVCADIGCETRLTTGVSTAEAGDIRSLFAAVVNAAQERKAIALALGKFELYVGRQDKINTWDDRAGNSHLGKIVQSRQTDCFAESHNATSYLLVLTREGLLKFHSLGEISRRGILFDQHYAALIIDRATKENYIVDTWFLANAYPAVVLPYSEWKEKKEAPYLATAKSWRESQ